MHACMHTHMKNIDGTFLVLKGETVSLPSYTEIRHFLVSIVRIAPSSASTIAFVEISFIATHR